MLAGASTVFFAYTGFDSVTSTAEEVYLNLPKKIVFRSTAAYRQDIANNFSHLQVKNPQKDLPVGIGFALSICCTLYMLVSVVIVGLVPYYAMDPDTPISSAFSSHGMEWAAYVNINLLNLFF